MTLFIGYILSATRICGRTQRNATKRGTKKTEGKLIRTLGRKIKECAAAGRVPLSRRGYSSRVSAVSLTYTSLADVPTRETYRSCIARQRN